MRDLLRAYLSKTGYQVATAENGQEGLKLAKKLSPHAITLDVEMPGMDGWSVLTQLKADPDLEKIPVVILSITEDKRTGYSLGAADYLSKPINRMQLLQVLHKYRFREDFSVLVVDDVSTSGATLNACAQALAAAGAVRVYGLTLARAE